MSIVLSADRPVTDLPGEAFPYVVPAGNGRAHLLISDVARALVGKEESNGLLSFLSDSGARADRPIPLHYHEHEHEFFFCFDGLVQLWAGDESRVMAPGDFGSVPPGTAHAYQHHRNGATFVGPVTPGGWDRFMDLVGEPFAGGAYAAPPYPPPPFERFGQAEQQFAMKYLFEMEYAAPTFDAPDDTLPGERRPYFLRATEGIKHLLGGQLQTALCRAEETDGAVTMTTVDMPLGTGLPAHLHEQTHEVLFIVEGRVRVTLAGEDHLVTRGDAINVPAGTVHTYVSESHRAKVLTTSCPGGLERLFAVAGEATDSPIFGVDPATAIDKQRLTAAAESVDVTFI